MEKQAQWFNDRPMTFNLVKSIVIVAAAIASNCAMAATSDECVQVERSIAQRKAVSTETTVFAAVRANDPAILQTKYPIKTAQRKLQTMFLEFCKDFSGYKAFQVEARGGSSGSVVCNGSINYAFAIKKKDIIIKELSDSGDSKEVEIPDLDGNKDLFSEFK